MALESYLAGEVAEDFKDGLMTRREALRRLVMLGLSVTGAGALLAACGGDDNDDGAAAGSSSTTAAGAGASTTVASDGAGGGETITLAGPSGQLTAAFAAAEPAQAALLVIHENRGLTPHFLELVGRLAGEGYTALCVDLLSPEGGTASLTDPAAAPAALSAAPLERLLGDLRAGIDELQKRAPGQKVGAVGFCFGGSMTWELLHAGEERLAAAAPFYGTPPDNADFSKAKAAVLGIYAELDDRVNGTRPQATAALVAAGLTHDIRTFTGAEHGFFNDTGSRYNAEAATQAQVALLDWFGRHLA